MSFFGNMVSKEGVIVDQQKVEAIKSWARMANVIEIYSFVGLSNYFHKFVKGFASIASRMSYLTQKDVQF